MKIALLGPPGSGKGTIAKRLSKSFKLFNLSTGEILRDQIKKDTLLSKELKKYMDRGELVPNHFVEEVVRLELHNKKRYVLDGFPRKIDEAKATKDFKLDLVIYLHVPDEDLIKRLADRRHCQKGLHNYHLIYFPSKKPGICDIDKSKLIRRKDDNPKVIKERLKVYHHETEPVIKYFQRKKILRTIDGAPHPKEVYKAVKRVVKEYLR